MSARSLKTQNIRLTRSLALEITPPGPSRIADSLSLDQYGILRPESVHVCVSLPVLFAAAVEYVVEVIFSGLKIRSSTNFEKEPV